MKIEYASIFKQAWQIAWRHKILWLFSFFATGSIVNLITALPQEFFMGLPDAVLEMVPGFGEIPVAVMFAAAILLLLIFAFKVVGVAAFGGLIKLTDDAASENEVKGMAGWQTGFSLWFRVFFLLVMVIVPAAVISLVIAAVTVLPLILALPGGAMEAGVLFACGAMVVVFPLMLAIGVAAELFMALGLRHAIIGGRSALASLAASATDIRSRFKNVIVVWLLLVVVAIVGATLLTAAVSLFELLYFARDWVGYWLTVPVYVVYFLTTSVYVAIWWSFNAAAWTLLYRRLRADEAAAEEAGQVQEAPAVPTSLADPITGDSQQDSDLADAPPSPYRIPDTKTDE